MADEFGTVESIVKRKLRRLEQQYDAENDVAEPRVSHTERELMACVEELLWAVRKQQEQIEELTAAIRRSS